VDVVRSSPLLVSLDVGGAFASTLRDRVRQARVLLVCEQGEAVDEIGLQAAQSRLAYLLRLAAEHGIDVEAADRRSRTQADPW
jgi:hypothetical protein